MFIETNILVCKPKVVENHRSEHLPLIVQPVEGGAGQYCLERTFVRSTWHLQQCSFDAKHDSYLCWKQFLGHTHLEVSWDKEREMGKAFQPVGWCFILCKDIFHFGGLLFMIRHLQYCGCWQGNTSLWPEDLFWRLFLCVKPFEWGLLARHHCTTDPTIVLNKVLAL